MSRAPRGLIRLRRIVPVLLVVAASSSARSASPAISGALAVALKDGSRAAIVWRTDAPTTGLVRFGTQASHAVRIAGPRSPDAPGTDHLAVLDFLTPGQTYFVSITAIGPGGISTADLSFVARNGAGAVGGGAPINLLVRLDWDATGAEMAGWATALTEGATRFADMTDGWVRLGTVVLADAAAHDLAGTPYCTVADCVAGADLVAYTGVGLDLYAGGRRVPVMWPQSIVGGIERSGASIEIPRYIGYPLAGYETAAHPHAGPLIGHELGHYALWLADQYGAPGETCSNAAYDLSIMHSLASTEIDSRDTPCAWQQTHGVSSWDALMRPHYPHIPSRAGAPDPGPETPGGAFATVLLNR